MNYNIISATKSDLDFVLSLNQDSLSAVSQLDISKINHFLQISSYFKIFKIDDKSVGFMIGLKAGKDYKSENYIWINQRYSSFIYVDRIIIGSNYRNEGLGFYFYDHLIESCRERLKIFCVK